MTSDSPIVGVAELTQGAPTADDKFLQRRQQIAGDRGIRLA
jgi:hypothetical protein